MKFKVKNIEGHDKEIEELRSAIKNTKMCICTNAIQFH